MSSEQILTPDQGAPISRLLGMDGPAIKRLSTLSGVSAVTLRKIASTGQVQSYVTAIALERATDGEIKADKITSLSTKGAELYRREPARSLLMLAMEQGITIARLLGRHGLTTGDLWAFMNAPSGKNERAKENVKAVLQKLNLATIREESK